MWVGLVSTRGRVSTPAPTTPRVVEHPIGIPTTRSHYVDPLEWHMLMNAIMRRLTLVMTGAAVVALTSGVVGWFATRLLVGIV